MSLRARQNGGGKIRQGGGRGNGNGSPGGRGNNGGGGGDTWNPSSKGTNVTLSNGNLTATIGGTAYQWALSTTSKTTGKWYFEVLVGAQSNNFGDIAVVMATQDPTLEIATGGLSQRGSGGWNPGGGVNGSQWWNTPGNVVGMAVDVDARTVTAYLNGVANGSHSSATVGARRIGVAQSWGTAAVSYAYTLRTTSAEFSYSPPTGYLPWGS